MKRILSLLIILGALSFILVRYNEGLSSFWNRWLKFSFCDNPVTYKIGYVDPKFEISDKQVKEDINSGAKMWNEIAGWNLFIEDDASELDINLVYDERQSSIKNINKKKIEVEKEKEKYEAELAMYDSEKARVQLKLDKLNEEIKHWNSEGGAPQDIYSGLVNKQEQIQNEINRINDLTDKVNETTDRINNEIETINKRVSDFNNLISSLPEEGLFMGGEEKIEVYIYDTQDGFIRTVAHELGHALGLDHTETTDSLMNPTSSPTAHITDSDIELFNTYCSEQDRLQLIKNDLQILVKMLFSKLNDVLTLNT